MINTSDLINTLSNETGAYKPIRTPRYLSSGLLAVLIAYGVIAQTILGLRPDLAMQFTRPLFTLEVALLAMLLITSVIASVLAMYPDAYQNTKILKIPYGVFLLLMILVTVQLVMPKDGRMVMPEAGHGMECALCIGIMAFIPSTLLFLLLRKGASIRQFQAGAFAVLAASSVGCLTLRLAEMNDSLAHLVTWHYLPALLFAALGALIGKWLLRW